MHSVYRKERGMLKTHISVQEFLGHHFACTCNFRGIENSTIDFFLTQNHLRNCGLGAFQAPWQIFHTRQGYYRSYTGSNSRLARLALMAVARTSEGKTFLSTNAPSNRGDRKSVV